MQFFREKPLCLMILVMLGGFSLFSIQNKIISLVLTVLLASALITNCIYKYKKKDNYPFHILLFVLLCISVLFSYLYFNIFHDVPEKEAVIEAEIIDSEYTEYRACYQVKCKTIDGKRKNVNLTLYADEKYKGLEIGDIIVTKVALSPYNIDEPNDGYKFSKGLAGEAQHISDTITKIDHKDRLVRTLIRKIRLSFI